MRKLLSLTILFSLLFSSCVKEKFDSSKLAGVASLTPGLLVPVGHATMRLSKYLNDSFASKLIEIGPDNSITLVYHEKVFSLPASGLISIPDVSSDFYLIEPLSSPPKRKGVQTSTIITDTAFINMPIQGATAFLDSIRFESGMLKLDVINNLNLAGKCNIILPGLNDSIYFPTLVAGHNIGSLSLSKKTMQFFTQNGKPDFIKAIVVFGLAQTDTNKPGTQLLDINFSFSNIHYSVIYGNIGKISLPVNSGSFEIGFYKRLTNGNLYFSDPELDLLFKNSIGFPVELYFTDLYTTTRNLPKMPLTGEPLVSNPLYIAFPTILFQTSSDSLILNSANSNIPAILSAAPTSLSFSVVDSINPVSHMRKGFITDSSKLEAELQLKLPLKGHTDSALIERQTINFQFPSDLYTNQNDVKFVYFILNTENGFPFEIRPQVYFTDNNLNVIDSLFTSSDTSMIHSAKVSVDGSVSNTITDQIIVKFTPQRIQKILNATHLITQASMVSPGARKKDVLFLKKTTNSALYALTFSMGVIVQLQINTGL